jgi:hypothetical protein
MALMRENWLIAPPVYATATSFVVGLASVYHRGRGAKAGFVFLYLSRLI